MPQWACRLITLMVHHTYIIQQHHIAVVTFQVEVVIHHQVAAHQVAAHQVALPRQVVKCAVYALVLGNAKPAQEEVIIIQNLILAKRLHALTAKITMADALIAMGQGIHNMGTVLC